MYSGGVTYIYRSFLSVYTHMPELSTSGKLFRNTFQIEQQNLIQQLQTDAYLVAE
jgi:hypothetical protein